MKSPACITLLLPGHECKQVQHQHACFSLAKHLTASAQHHQTPLANAIRAQCACTLAPIACWRAFQAREIAASTDVLHECALPSTTLMMANMLGTQNYSKVRVQHMAGGGRWPSSCRPAVSAGSKHVHSHCVSAHRFAAGAINFCLSAAQDLMVPCRVPIEHSCSIAVSQASSIPQQRCVPAALALRCPSCLAVLLSAL